MSYEILFKKKEGKIDDTRIRQFLHHMPNTFQDPVREDTFLLCGTEIRKENLFKERQKATPDSRYPYTGLVLIRPDWICVYLEGDSEAWMQSTEFVKWLINEYQFDEVSDDYCNDLTKLYKESPVVFMEKVFEIKYTKIAKWRFKNEGKSQLFLDTELVKERDSNISSGGWLKKILGFLVNNRKT